MLAPLRARGNDVRRLAQIHAPKTRSSGTGYLLGNGLVLTARHVVRPDDSALTVLPLVQVRPFRVAPEISEWLEAKVVWPSLEALHDTRSPDVVLLRLSKPLAELAAPVAFGLAHLADEAECRVHVVGFPAFRKDADPNRPRDTETVIGFVEPSTAMVSGRFEIKGVSLGRGERIGPGTEWAGLSGGALIADRRVIGVVEARVEGERVEFYAQRLDPLMVDQGFAEAVHGAVLLGDAPVVVRQL